MSTVHAHKPRRRSHASPRDAVRGPLVKPLDVLVVGRGVVPVKVGCGGAELAMFQLSRSIGLAGHHVTLVADVDTTDFPESREIRIVAVGGRIHRLASRLPN